MNAHDKLALLTRPLTMSDGPKVFRYLASFPEGRAVLNQHRQSALRTMRCSNDHAEWGGSAWLILNADAHLSHATRQVASKRSAASGKQWADGLRSLQQAAEFSCMLLYRHAWEIEYTGSTPGDMNELWMISRRIHREAGAMLKKMGKKPNPSTGYMDFPRAPNNERDAAQ